MNGMLRATSGMRPQDKRALAMGVMIVVALLGYAHGVRPAIAGLRAEGVAVAEQRALLARERALLAAAPMLPRARSDVERTLTSARARLFAGDSVAATAALTSYLADVATATGVQLTTIDGRAPSTVRGVTRLLVEVRGEGGWRETLGFVRTMESAGQLVNVTDIRIERGPRGGPLGGNTVTIAATVAGYGSSLPDVTR